MIPYETLQQGAAKVQFVEQDRALVPEVLSSVNAAAVRLSRYFGIQDVPSIRTILTPSRSEFDRCVREVLRIQIEVPSSPVRVAQPQRTDLVLLSPSAWDRELHKFTADGFRRLIAHEVAHIVEEHLSPNIERLPRWWSEGLAMYTSGQWAEPDAKRRVLSALETNEVPSTSMMQDGPVSSDGVRLCYMWGWTLVMYVDRVLGRDLVTKVVRECQDGDVFRALGRTRESLEAGWRKWQNGLLGPELLGDDAG